MNKLKTTRINRWILGMILITVTIAMSNYIQFAKDKDVLAILVSCYILWSGFCELLYIVEKHKHQKDNE